METPNFSVIVHKNQLNLMGLVHAMRSNGPLPQVSGVQSFVRTNDCKSKFYFHFWSAIVRTYERLQVKFLFLFQECNRSHVQTIASQIFLFHFWSAIVRTYEQLQVKILFFISGVQSFVRTNDCKPNFFISFLE